MRQGRISAGIVALADALTSGMEWFCAAAERRDRVQGAREGFPNDPALYAALVRSGVLDGAFDFGRFDLIVDKALETELSGADAAGVLAGLESVFTQLGVLPFDESELPPEIPGTL